MNNKKQLDFQTIAVDFDGTLCYSKWPELGQPNHALIEYLQEWKRNGNKLILWTCRAGEALSKAVEWCREQNLEFDAIVLVKPFCNTLFDKYLPVTSLHWC